VQPPYGLSDEPAHTVKALAASHGEIRGPKSIGQFGYSAMEFNVPSAYSSIWHFTCYSGDVNTTPKCSPPFSNGINRVKVTSTAAEYPPIYYSAVGIFGWISPGQFGLFLMRTATVLIFVSLLSMSAHLLIANGFGKSLGVLLICATPTVISFSGAVNPFSPEVAASVLYWTSGILSLKSSKHQPKKVIASCYLSSIAFGVIRPASFLWILISMFIIALTSLSFSQVKSVACRRINAIHFFCATGIGVLLSTLWYFFGMSVHSLGAGSPAGGKLFDNMAISLRHTPSYLKQIFGFFGWTTFYAPNYVMLLLISAAILLFLVNLRYQTREVVGLVLLLFFLIAGPAVLEGTRAASSGWGFQGRYLIPVAVGIPILLVLGGNQRQKSMLLGIITPLTVLAHLGALNYVSKRFTVGLSGQFFWASKIEWSGVGGPIVIQIAFLVTICLGITFTISQIFFSRLNQ
jgi:hypothetical protein